MKFIRDIRPYFSQKLAVIYGENEAKSMAYWSIESVLGLSKSDCIMKQLESVATEDCERFLEIVARLENQEPIQYILGDCFFYSMRFEVNEHTLIPRPETEELVRWVLEDKFTSALDIGTGSGCIAISLAKNSAAQILALDISEKALEVAKRNAKTNKVDISFLKADILKVPSLNKYDVIVSNPPYVLESEKEVMRRNVLKHEPHTALFVPDNNALLFYEAIAQFAQFHLNSSGKLFFEINEQKGKETQEMLQKKGFQEIEIRQDLQGKDRMVKAIWKM